MLSGYKTYICVAIGLVLACLRGLDLIDPEYYMVLLGLVCFGSVGAVRAAIKKILSGN